MSYRQLTEEQRYQISLLLSEKFSLRTIALKLGVSPSTISRELRRNSLNAGCYEPDKAQVEACQRRHSKSTWRICETTRAAVELMLELDWSSEQVSAICKRIGRPVSHEWIYTYVLANFKQGGNLYLHLRHRLKRYKKRFHQQRGRILGRRSIHDRPAVVNDKSCYSDWDIDTVIDKHSTGVIVNVLERKSRFYVTQKVASKQSTVVVNALINMLQPFKALVHTITADNGLEFAEHKQLAERLETKVYFAEPYASYQRGANENANGLLRQYVPKGADLRS